MDEAYALWQKPKNGSWSTEEFFDHLSYIQRVAVSLGNLNYQVENGGFAQWISNGYADAHYDFLMRLKKEVDEKKFSQLAQALKLVEISRSYDDPDEKEFSEELDELDESYYRLNVIEKQMEEFIASLI